MVVPFCSYGERRADSRRTVSCKLKRPCLMSPHVKKIVLWLRIFTEYGINIMTYIVPVEKG